MAPFSSVDAYVEQWLKIATKGNVVSHRALYQDRIQFKCLTCEQTLTVTTDAIQMDGTVAYCLQQFINIHAHVGGHEPKPWDGSGDSIPMTVDFKKLKQDDAFAKKNITQIQKDAEGKAPPQKPPSIPVTAGAIWDDDKSAKAQAVQNALRIKILKLQAEISAVQQIPTKVEPQPPRVEKPLFQKTGRKFR
jgi:hypothetical protein